MSMEWYRWAADLRGLKAPQKAVLKELADRFNDEKGFAYPSMENMAERTGYNRTTVLRALKSLRELGLVSWTKERYKGHFAHNRYKLHRVAEHHVSECLEAKDNVAEPHLAKKSATMSQSEAPPRRTEQQKPLPKPLNITLNNKQVKNIASEGVVSQKPLSDKQMMFARKMAGQYFEKYKHEHHAFDSLFKDCQDFLRTASQSEGDWRTIGNGLPSPQEMGYVS